MGLEGVVETNESCKLKIFLSLILIIFAIFLLSLQYFKIDLPPIIGLCIILVSTILFYIFWMKKIKMDLIKYYSTVFSLCGLSLILYYNYPFISWILMFGGIVSLMLSLIFHEKPKEIKSKNN